MTDRNNFHDHEKFRDQLSLIGTCKRMANELEKELQQHLTGGKVCIGFHLRHVFDTSAPSVGLNASSDGEAIEISKINKSYGLQTLNHILDTLYYDSRKNDHSNTPPKLTQLCIQIDFDKQSSQDMIEKGCHVFDREKNKENKHDWLNCHYSVLKGRIFECDRVYIRDFVSGVIDLRWEQPNITQPLPAGSR